MGRIFAHYTVSRVMWEDGCDDPVKEYGWIDRRWSRSQLYDSRNDVSPVISLDEDDEDLMDEVRDALEWLEGGYEDNGCGMFYSRESYNPSDEPWSYSYALHFTRKYYGAKGWTEEPWVPPL